MFNRLLANIAVNPSALSAFILHSKRLKQEASVRKLGLFFLVLALIVQIMISLFPMEKSLKFSDNNIINGIETRDDILQEWDKSSSDVSEIYSKFGLKRQDLANLPNKPDTFLTSVANSNYWVVERSGLSGYTSEDNRLTNQELSLKTDGPTVYFRPLHTWGIQTNHASYKAFKGRNGTTGKDFWILVSSGNYIQVGKTINQDQPKKPELFGRKTIQSSNNRLKPGDTFKYVIAYRNRVSDSLAENVQIESQFDIQSLDVIDQSNAKIEQNGRLTYYAGNLGATNYYKVLVINVRIKETVKNGTTICNTVKVSASNADAITLDEASRTCIEVGLAQDSATAEAPLNQDKPLPGLSISVKNITKNLTGKDALEATLSSGDILEYSLITTNEDASPLQSYDIKNYVGDVLDYADIDSKALASQGAVLDTTKEIIWKNQTINARAELVKSFRVTVKNPVPSTNSPSPTSTNFDCRISNKYGDEITIRVACPVLKNIEKWPNISAGTSISIGFSITLLSSYFFVRARLLTKESAMIKRTYQQKGQAN